MEPLCLDTLGRPCSAIGEFMTPAGGGAGRANSRLHRVGRRHGVEEPQRGTGPGPARQDSLLAAARVWDLRRRRARSGLGATRGRPLGPPQMQRSDRQARGDRQALCLLLLTREHWPFHPVRPASAPPWTVLASESRGPRHHRRPARRPHQPEAGKPPPAVGCPVISPHGGATGGRAPARGPARHSCASSAPSRELLVAAAQGVPPADKPPPHGTPPQAAPSWNLSPGPEPASEEEEKRRPGGGRTRGRGSRAFPRPVMGGAAARELGRPSRVSQTSSGDGSWNFGG